jgi:hypothetical protein
VTNRVGPSLGRALLTLGTIVGAVLVGASTAAPKRSRGLLLLGGAGLLLGASHDLAHLLAGDALGIRWIGLYLNRHFPFQPGAKVDSASYLRATPLARAIMHASGAVVTKLVPFVALAVGRRSRAPSWALILLAAIGSLQIGTDLVFSTRYSDWWRVGRQVELAYTFTRRSPPRPVNPPPCAEGRP